MTDASLPSPSSTGRRRAAREREYRRLRILAMAPAGWSYAAIGREAAISRERAPQTVAKAFEASESETTPWPRPPGGAGSVTATRRRTRPIRQSSKPPLTRRKPLIRNDYALDKACHGLTSLDKT
jgi:hypothetical protein